MATRFRVIGFFYSDAISVLSHKKLSDVFQNFVIIGDDYWTVQEAISAGEEAWKKNHSLNYRIELVYDMYGESEIVMIRYANFDYTIYCLD